MSLRPRARGKPRPSQAQKMRQQLLKKLPAMLDAAIAAYQRIALADPVVDDPKQTSAAHAGAKAILVHIDQIIKLAEAAVDSTQARDVASNDVEAILVSARTALSRDQEEEDGDKPPGQ